MDVNMAAGNVPVNVEPVAATSMVEEGNGNEGETMSPPAKRKRFDQGMNRVAEIVLVLSALGRMRGGKTPTELEQELMVEARSKLAELCQEFTPKDIIGSDDVRAVIEDLGLNGKDQLKAPKLTISEKLSLGKRKMEEANQFLAPTVSTGYVSHLSQPHGQPLSSGIVNVSSPFGSVAKNVPVSNKWVSSEVTPVNIAGTQFRMERPKLMLNGAASQGTSNYSANYYAASWSAQPQSTISFGTAPSKKVPIQSSVRVKDPSFRPFMSHTPHGTFPGTNQPMQGMHYGQTSSFRNNHNDIAKIIYNVLHPRVKQHPVWNQPSTDYMSRAMTCQMCQVTINEVQSLLICDACEKAYHLKCLQANGMKALTKSEWHCSKCVHASSGKPFPPQYGRVISTAAAKMPSSAAGIQSSTAKKFESMDTKVDLQKPIVTTSPRVQKFSGFVSGAATTSHFARVNANTTASAAMTTNIGPQGFRESLIRSTNSLAPVSLTKTPNPTAFASSSTVINGGFISKPLTPVGTMSSTSLLPIGDQVPVNATTSATPGTTITSSPVAQAPKVSENGDSSSTTSGTADYPILNAELTTQVPALTVTSTNNSQPLVPHSETAKETEDTAVGQALNANDGQQAPMEIVARCENPSESTSHSDSLNDKTTPDNCQESSKDATEKFASESYQNHPTESPAAVVSDQVSKITTEPFMPHENSAHRTEKTASQPPSVLSKDQSKTEKETPNIPGDSQEGKELSGLDDRREEKPSDPEFDKSDSIKEANSA